MKHTLLIACLILAGCAAKPAGKKIAGPPKLPPAAPPVRIEPLRAELAAAARRQVEQAAASSDPFIRAHAIEAARAAHNHASSWTRPIILAGLADPSAPVRFAALLAAGELRISEAAVAAAGLADDTDRNVRVGALFCLHRLGDTRRSHELEKLARDPSSSVRANVVVVLGLLGEPSGVKILRALRNDPSPAVRVQVWEAMWRLGEQEGLDALVAGTISGYPDDQMISVLALAAPRDQRVIEHVRGLLVTDYPETALVASRAMGMLGSDEGYAVVQKGAQSPDPRQRHLAALAFGAIGRTDAQEALSKLLDDTDADVRLAAAGAILQLPG